MSYSNPVIEKQKNFSREYARLTSQPELSDSEMNRMAEIWEEAQSDDVLSLLITEIEELALQHSGFIDRESIPDSEDTDNCTSLFLDFCNCNDTLYGGAGFDLICWGGDYIVDEEGYDYIWAGSGSDCIDGGLGTNSVKYEPDSDWKKWFLAFVERVSAAKESSLSNTVLHIDIDLPQINPDARITRYKLTSKERAALDDARQNHLLIVLTVENDSYVMSALCQTFQEFDNIIILFSRKRAKDDLADAAAKVSGIISQVWAENPELSYRQILEILMETKMKAISRFSDRQKE